MDCTVHVLSVHPRIVVIPQLQTVCEPQYPAQNKYNLWSWLTSVVMHCVQWLSSDGSGTCRSHPGLGAAISNVQVLHDEEQVRISVCEKREVKAGTEAMQKKSSSLKKGTNASNFY